MLVLYKLYSMRARFNASLSFPPTIGGEQLAREEKEKRRAPAFLLV